MVERRIAFGMRGPGKAPAIDDDCPKFRPMTAHELRHGVNDDFGAKDATPTFQRALTQLNSWLDVEALKLRAPLG